ncbi:MAG: hypothetical protein ACI4KF_07270 [Huintestinicola sp.]
MSMNIYKLLNSDEIMTTEYDELSNEEVSRIMTRFKSEHSQKKRDNKMIGKRFAAVLAAAVITISGGIFAYAYDKGLLQIIFGGESENYISLEGLTGEMDIHSLEVYRDDVTVTPEGYASDGNVIFCVFRMDFEKRLFPEDEYYEVSNKTEVNGIKYMETHYTPKLDRLREMLPTGYDSSIEADTVLKRVDEDTMYAIFRIVPSLMSKGTKELDYTCFSIWKNNSPIINEHIFSADFSVDIKHSSHIEMETNGTILDECTLSVTPCSIGIESYSADLFIIIERLYTDDFISDNSFYVLMKDGRKIHFNGFNGSANQLESGEKYAELKSVTDLPVDTSNVQAVVMGENIFTVKGE